MRVCFFISNLGDGGAQRQCIALLNFLQHNSDVELHLVLIGNGEHDGSLDTTKLTVHRKQVGNFANPLALVFLIQTLRRIRPHILMSWLHPADIWSYVATRIVRDVSWILAERGSSYPDELAFRVRKWMGQRGADAIVANSQAGKRFWEQSAARSPVVVIPNITLSSAPATDPEQRGRSTACLFVGRLEAQKNVGAMTSAFARFTEVQPQAELLVVGQGSEEKVVTQTAIDHGIANCVELMGFRRDVPDLMAKARLLLAFSHYEGMPNVLMEAIASDLPAVVSDIPEHRELLGPRYPYLVPLEMSSSEAAEVMARAWVESFSVGATHYKYAKEVLKRSSPSPVAAAYLQLFRKVAGFASTSQSQDQECR